MTGRIVVAVTEPQLLEVVLAELKGLGVATVSGPREPDPLVLVVTPSDGQDPELLVRECRELLGVAYAEVEGIYEAFE